MRALTDSEKWRSRFLRYAPLILWIGVIFLLSSNVGSMNNTSRFIRPLLRFLFPDAPEELLQIYHGYIRKLAHVTEYAILAFFASRAFFSSSVNTIAKNWFVFSFALVVAVACLDEFNQSFLSSRTASPFDVMLDCFGGLVMILLFFAFKAIGKLS
ncbi:MAG: VanZ family protein [Acidobacteria bacterium]|jgi:VanZ family protein|nr:MAG: VanZ family protein [Acidobacteriota bacterium]GIU81826.1 MAG: teicoplanin resistance protein VanZ [Pyrinomonadaceae bacterium]